MTNAEKYQQVFGFPPDTASCPTDQCDICPGNDNFRCKSKVNFWEKEYVEPERPQGEWGIHGECPFCSYIRKWKEDNFCGNCGAKLGKGGTE